MTTKGDFCRLGRQGRWTWTHKDSVWGRMASCVSPNELIRRIARAVRFADGRVVRVDRLTGCVPGGVAPRLGLTIPPLSCVLCVPPFELGAVRRDA